jgi:hypothetical protein
LGITATAIYAPGDTITSAWANILRTNTGVLDSRTGGDPGSANLMLVSDGATSAAWVARLTAVTAALGYTPLKNVTDTLTGNLTVTGTVSAATVSPTTSYTGGTQAAGVPSVLGLNVGTSGIASTGAINPASYTGGSTSTGSPSVLGLNVGASGIAVGAGGVAVSGPVSGTTGTFSGAVSGTTGTFSGAVSGASYTGGTTSSGTPSVQGLNVGSNGIASTAAITVGGVALGRLASGSYSGNDVSTGRQITTGFVAKYVHLYGTDGANDYLWIIVSTSKSIRLFTTPTINGQTTVHLHASDGFVVGDTTTDGNASGYTYTYAAFG